MDPRSTFAAITVTLLAALPAVTAGCGPSPQQTAEPSGETKSAPSTRGPGVFAREQLIEDTRELARVIEDSHPDPYSGGGGRIAFHRRLHRALNAIPDAGMTKDEFYRLLRPFVAGIGDAHTSLMRGYRVDHDRPGGVPLRFRVVEESLVVVGTEERNRVLLGSRLVSVEGLPLAELVARQRQLQGIDNEYHALHVLATRSLAYRPYMQDLIPEWTDTNRVRVELRRPDATLTTVELEEPRGRVAEVNPTTRAALPLPGDAGFRTAFLQAPEGGQAIAYVRFTHMGGYLEAVEQRKPLLVKLTRPASATDAFRTLVIQMKQRATRTLVLDVRGNPGGNSLISEMLVYFLYGKAKLLDMAGAGKGETGAFRYSRLYFLDRPAESLEAINRGRAVPLLEGDYDFAWSYVDGKPIARRSGANDEAPIVKFLRLSPTFRAEYDAGTYSGYYAPPQVIVLCDAGTGSAGFSVVVEFWRLGATTVGTPPAQAPNSYGAAGIARLRHTGLEFTVPMISAAHFPDDPSKAHVLPVDHPLTYERFKSFGFDPNAEYLHALALR